MMGTITTPPVNMSQRGIMQYLSLDEWKIVSRLPVPAGQVMLDRMHAFGWIERLGSKSLAEIRLTHRDLKRCGLRFEAIRRLIEIGLKAKGK